MTEQELKEIFKLLENRGGSRCCAIRRYRFTTARCLAVRQMAWAMWCAKLL